MNTPRGFAMVSVGVATGVGSAAGYLLAHLGDLGLPAWAAWFIGAGLTAVASVVHLYQDNPNSRS